MKIKLNTLKILFLFFAIIVSAISKSQVHEQDISKYSQMHQAGLELRYTAQDSALQLFTGSYNGFLTHGDTLQAIKSLIELSSIQDIILDKILLMSIFREFQDMFSHFIFVGFRLQSAIIVVLDLDFSDHAARFVGLNPIAQHDTNEN